MKKNLATITALWCLTLAPAAAQEPRKDPARRAVGSFEALPERVRVGQTVYVTDTLARETAGSLVRLSDSAVTLLVQGAEREFPRAQVHQVARRGDSVGEGMAVGFLISSGLGLLTVLGAADTVDSGGAAGGILAMGSIGAGVGALIDYAIKGRTVVYRAKPVGLTASPVLLRGGAGVRVAVRF